MSDHLTRSTLVSFSKEKQLSLVIDGEHTSTGNAAEDIGTCTLEERPNTFLGNDLASSVQRRLVLDSL